MWRCKHHPSGFISIAMAAVGDRVPSNVVTKLQASLQVFSQPLLRSISFSSVQSQSTRSSKEHQPPLGQL